MYCKNCGSNLSDDANFCPACGTHCEKANESIIENPVTQINSTPAHSEKIVYPTPITSTTPRKPWYKKSFSELSKKQKLIFCSIITICLIVVIVSIALIPDSNSNTNSNTNNSNISNSTQTNGSSQSNNITLGQKNALSAAKRYLSVSAFSYEGLKDQLLFEGYTDEEATYGVNNCGANWYEQAAKKAKQYLSISSFSKQALIQQLEFEKFTHDQAVYGAEANGY